MTRITSQILTTPTSHQNVSGTSDTIGFFPYAWPEYSMIKPGWTVDQIPNSRVVSTDGDNHIVTISGGSFTSGSSYTFSGKTGLRITGNLRLAGTFGIPLPSVYTVGIGTFVESNGNFVGGDGNFTLPINTTAQYISPLFIVTQDKYLGDGYMNPATPITVVENDAAQNWLYMWMSYTQFDNPGSGSPTNNAPLNGNFIAFSEFLRGTSYSPYVLSNWSVADSVVNSMSTSISVNDGEMVVLATGVELGGGNVTSVNFGGLTWTRKCALQTVGSPDRLHDFIWSELWYAYNNTGNTINDNIIVNFTSQFDDGGIIITTWNGVDSTNPWV